MLDDQDQEFIPRGESLINIKRIDLSLLHSHAKRAKFIALCDVQNPFHGENGAAYVYALQKGASPEQIQKLDLGLKHGANLIQQQTGIDLQKISGSGAGGGIAGGLHVFLNAKLTRGIDVVFDITKFREVVRWADVVITGEGKVDEQTWQGKVVSGVIDQARSLQKRAIIVCGQATSSSPHQIPILSLSQEFGQEHATKNPAAALTAIAGNILKHLS